MNLIVWFLAPASWHQYKNIICIFMFRCHSLFLLVWSLTSYLNQVTSQKKNSIIFTTVWTLSYYIIMKFANLIHVFSWGQEYFLIRKIITIPFLAPAYLHTIFSKPKLTSVSYHISGSFSVYCCLNFNFMFKPIPKHNNNSNMFTT